MGIIKQYIYSDISFIFLIILITIFIAIGYLVIKLSKVKEKYCQRCYKTFIGASHKLICTECTRAEIKIKKKKRCRNCIQWKPSDVIFKSQKNKFCLCGLKKIATMHKQRCGQFQ